MEAPAPGGSTPNRSSFCDYLTLFMWGMPLFLFYTHFVFQNFKVPTESMENTVLIGDHITVNKFCYGEAGWFEWLLPSKTPKRGDIIAFKYPLDPEMMFIKRLVGVPGDRIDIRSDQLFLEGLPMTENYTYYKDLPGQESDRDPKQGHLPHDYSMNPGLANAHLRMSETVDLPSVIQATRLYLQTTCRDRNPRLYRQLVNRLESTHGRTIPPGFYFVMGDNRNRSSDSRSWGLVPKEFIRGRALWIWWSYGEDEGTHRLTGLQQLKTYLRYPVTFWSRTHWSRCFTRLR